MALYKLWSYWSTLLHKSEQTRETEHQLSQLLDFWLSGAVVLPVRLGHTAQVS